MSDEIKTVIGFQRKEKPLQPEPITNPKEIERTILENLRSGFTFAPAKLPGANEDSRLEEKGFLHRRFLLSHIREWLGLEQIDDPIILSCLDEIAKSGKVEFHRIELTRDMNIHDMGFVVEVGRGIRSWHGQNAPKIIAVKFYAARPLSEKEMKDPQTIFDVRARVEKIREEQDRRRRDRYGIFSKETEIEEKLRKIDQQATSEMDKNLSVIINKAKKK